ncbi:hypothetical protein [Paracoccus aminophilus]|uniref:DUF1318 domain-containing protein n=1 Tax=Paracoccus aminophilus JCM 7686 TaxID=1367847 RepID=S5XYK2_PARAH|nr:hypothetical protein [Paracoccus aminophilus]AGT10382.1 hypothetical protein JCM7686_3347 [Paracoccus aminophilus JCM 7686]
MITKSILAAVAALVAVPAFAADTNPGKAMMAQLLNVDNSAYTLSELGRISAEKGNVNQQERARFITEQKAQGTMRAVADDSSTNYFGLAHVEHIGRD